MSDLSTLTDLIKPHNSLYYKPDQNKNPWVDRYRPKKITQILDQDEIIKVLSSSLETGELTHLLLHGSPGTGKTSTILAYARQLFGPKIFRERVLELNASDDRGINVVRNKINLFAKSALCNPDPRYPSPPFKLIILDEADAMTTEAQAALRKVMEEYSNITRFCFICNYINQIIDPIISRCSKFRFKPVNNQSLVSKLKFIAEKENMNLSDDVYDTVTDIVKGDVRKAIMTLQNIKYIYKPSLETVITVNQVYDLTGFIPSDLISDILCNIVTNKNYNSNTLIKDISSFIKLGYPVTSIINQVTRYIVNNNILTDIQKSLIFLNIGLIEKRLIDGSTEVIQIMALFMNILKTVNEKTEN